MPKRNSDRDHYDREIKRFKTSRKRIQIVSSSDSEDNSDFEPPPIEETTPKNADALAPETNDEQDKEPPTSDACDATAPDLDPELLVALGETTAEPPKYGEKIYDNLARLWLPILRKGLKADTKEKLLKEFLVPENCTLLQAPKLNAEIAAAVSDVTRGKDKRVETVQQQIGLGITALNKGLSVLLNNDSDRIQAVKHLSDSCRILCDVHHMETEARKKFVTPVLDKSFLNVITDVDRDETLFGNNLSEKIKASKAIEKQGTQIKKPNPPHKAPFTSSTTASTYRPRYPGNWTGPPRYSSNAYRGGRGGPRKTFPAGRRTPQVQTTKPQAQTKPRATM